jgi:hypothetical protein
MSGLTRTRPRDLGLFDESHKGGADGDAGRRLCDEPLPKQAQCIP